MNYFSSGDFAYTRDRFFIKGNATYKMNVLKLGMAFRIGWINNKFNVYLGKGCRVEKGRVLFKFKVQLTHYSETLQLTKFLGIL